MAATPHTSTGGWVYLNFTSKRFEGSVDMVFGFDREKGLPSALELYNPHDEYTPQSYVIPNKYFTNKTFYKAEYTYASQDATYLYNGYVKLSDYFNKTWNLSWEHDFEKAEKATRTVYWTDTVHITWVNIARKVDITKINHVYEGMDRWYLMKADVTKNREYYLRFWLDVVPSQSGGKYKYFVGVKPSVESLQQAISSGHFYCLDPWWDSGWTYKKKITIDQNKIDADLTDFPVLVVLNATNIDWTHVQDDLDDIRFVDSTETILLKAELEKYIVNDKAWIWVKVPSVSGTVDTVFYMYYGNAAAASAWDAENVWESSAVMVQHMYDNSDASHIMDSTLYNNDGTKKGANEPIETGSGKIDSAQSFDGVDDYVSAGAPASLDFGVGPLAVEAWVNTGATLTDGLGDIVSKFDQVNKKGFNFGIIGSEGNSRNLYFGIDNNKSDVAWVEVAPKLGAETQIWSLAVYNGKLYGGTAGNGKLYEWNGVNAWVEVAPKLGDETQIWSLAVYNGKLYGGTYLNGKLYEWNGVNAWVEKAPKLGAETYIYSLAVYNGKLYGGTRPNGKLYEWKTGITVTYDYKLDSGWKYVAAVKDATTLKLYVDGVLVATSAAFAAADYNLTNTSNLLIGLGTDYANMTIDEARIYNTAKLVEWIKADYYSGSNSLLSYGAESEIVEVTITSSPPTGAGYITVDGAGITTPQIYYWEIGSTYTLAAISPVDIIVGQSRYTYTNWSDAGAQSHIYTVTIAETVTANYHLEYYFTVTDAHDAATGEGWYDAGTATVNSTVSRPIAGGAGTQYETTGWTGTGSLASGGGVGSDTTGAFTINAYSTCTWNWKTQYYLTVNTNPPGIDSPTGEAWYDSGDTAHVSTDQHEDIVPGDSRYTFNSWTGANGTYTDATVAMTMLRTATANYDTQYYLTVTSAHGTSGGEDWYNDGATAYATVTPLFVPAGAGKQYAFTNWSGDATGTTSPSDPITMDAAKTATANWLLQYLLTIYYNLGINKLYVNGTQRTNNTIIGITPNTNVNATATMKPYYIFFKHELNGTAPNFVTPYQFNMTNPYTLWTYAVSGAPSGGFSGLLLIALIALPMILLVFRRRR